MRIKREKAIGYLKLAGRIVLELFTVVILRRFRGK